MRQSEILNEAPRRRVAPPAPVNTSGYKPLILDLMREFVTICHLRFKRDWADLAQQSVAQRRAGEEAEHTKRDDPDHPEPFEFDTHEYLIMAVNSQWERNTLFRVRSNIAHEHDEYQIRAAERHGYEDDLSNYIESSDYLSGMTAMETCAKRLESVQLGDPRIVPAVVQSCKSFLSDWDRHENPSDGGEAPMLDEDFTNSIERMLPLLLLLYS